MENCLGRFNAQKGKAISDVSTDVLTRLIDYPFPGIFVNWKTSWNTLMSCAGSLIEEGTSPTISSMRRIAMSVYRKKRVHPVHCGGIRPGSPQDQGGSRVNTARQLGISRTCGGKSKTRTQQDR